MMLPRTTTPCPSLSCPNQPDRPSSCALPTPQLPPRHQKLTLAPFPKSKMPRLPPDAHDKRQRSLLAGEKGWTTGTHVGRWIMPSPHACCSPHASAVTHRQPVPMTNLSCSALEGPQSSGTAASGWGNKPKN